jgi:hypothetical protein
MWRSRALYEWDSAQYALGILRFDVHDHRPHPPGYPLWIVLLKGVHLLVQDLNAAQIVLDLLVTGVAGLVFYRLARRLHGAATALLATALLLFSPPVIFYDAVASTYPADLLISSVLGALSIRLWQSEKRVGLWAVFAMALLAGVRQSGAVMMAPLVVTSLARAYGLDARRWAAAIVVGGVTVAAWYVPTAMMNGGIAEYQSYVSSTIRGYFHATSALFGAPAARHIEMVRNDTIWACAAMAVAVVMTTALWATGKLASEPRRTATVEPVTPSPSGPSLLQSRVGPAFYVLWILPNVLYVSLLHSVKPGYLVLDWPPVFLVLAHALAISLRRIAARWRVSALLVASLLALVSAVATTGLTAARYGGTLDRTSLASVRDSDADMRALKDLVARPPGPAATMIVVVGGEVYGPNARSLAVELPDATVAILFPDGPEGGMRKFFHREYVQEETEEKTIPRNVRRILWLYPRWGGGLNTLEQGFPGTRSLHDRETIRVFESNLGEQEVDTFVSFERKYHLVRAGTPPGPSCRLAAGFIDPVEKGDLLWGAGPWSEFVVDGAEASTIHLSMRVADVASSDEEIAVFANGGRITAIHPRRGEDMTLDVPGVSGRNRIRFVYSRYNHHPDPFAPLDPRPFAVAFREIRCQRGDREDILFSL